MRIRISGLGTTAIDSRPPAYYTGFAMRQPSVVRSFPAALLVAAALLLPASAEREEQIREVLATILGGNEQAESLVTRLNDEQFAVREDATLKLKVMKPFPLHVVRKATTSPDPEIRFRAKEVLASLGKGADSVIREQLAAIIECSPKGLTTELLQLMAGTSDFAMMMLGAEAVAKTALPSEEKELLAAVNHIDPAVRAVAATGLASLSRTPRPECRKLLNDPVEWVRLQAALHLANLGDRSSLPVLAALVGSKSQVVSDEASQILMLLTGQNISVQDIANQGSRIAAANQWERWIRDSSASSDLRFPLPRFRPQANIALVFHDNYRANSVIELDRNGRKRRDNLDLEFRAPWSVQRLANGNYIVGFMDRKDFIVSEFSPDGKSIWRSDRMDGGVISVQRLANGNTVAALSDAKKVVEIDAKGAVVWTAKTRTRATDAIRLANGNTLISEHVFPGKDLSGRLFEVDPQGEEVWSMEEVQDPQRIQRLPNGNTLVAQARLNQIAEFNRKGKMVWSYKKLMIPIDVHCLDDGTMLVIDSAGISWIHRERGLVRHTPMPGLARGCPY